MALHQITDRIWIGSLLALRAENTLKENGVTHVLTVLGTDPMNYDSQQYKTLPLFQQIKEHLVVQLEDLDDVDIMQYFDKTNSFIQDSIDSNGGVLVHCAAGISRSVTCVCAYLMKTNKWTPEVAISYVQARRRVANPNDGFREQLQIYYNCGFVISNEAKLYREWKLKEASHNLASGHSSSPVYTEVSSPPLVVSWKHIIPVILKRSDTAQKDPSSVHQVSADGVVYSITEPVADVMKPQLPNKLVFITNDKEIEISPALLSEVMKQVMTRMVSFRCKGCSLTLASSASIVRHPTGAEGNCQHFFLEPIEWMRNELQKGELEGKLFCPKCSKKVGSYLWQGSKCSCGSWITPSFKLSKAKVDEMATTSRPLL